MIQPFGKQFQVTWGDLDANRHMANTAYGNYATHVRFSFFRFCDFDQYRFDALRIGLVALHEEVQYKKELFFEDSFFVDVELVGLSHDYRFWQMCHTFTSVLNEQIISSILISGAWIDIDERKIRIPPPEVIDVLERMPRADTFVRFETLHTHINK